LTVVWVALAAAAALLAVLTVPRIFLRRAQDRLAKERLATGHDPMLLTRAELVAGRHRRVPGVLALTSAAIRFDGLFGEAAVIATPRIQKIETGQRLASGRLLYRLEVLRLTAAGGEQSEFVLSRDSAAAWRSHLGLWAVKERQADAERVEPGR
jgi:membrane protein YdbS with pleckstrin-like domain